MLFLLAVLAAFIAGVGMASRPKRSWLHMLAFATTTCVTVYVIIDLEYPRHGMIRLDAADRTMLEVRQSLDDPAKPSTENTPAR
jgi:hypothetical protein